MRLESEDAMKRPSKKDIETTEKTLRAMAAMSSEQTRISFLERAGIGEFHIYTNNDTRDLGESDSLIDAFDQWLRNNGYEEAPEDW
jgi:hypothetical protein